MGPRRLFNLEAPGDVLIAAARRASGRARALRGRTRLGLARLDARGAGIGQLRRKEDQRRDLSVPRAVASVAPEVGYWRDPRSLPLTVLIQRPNARLIYSMPRAIRTPKKMKSPKRINTKNQKQLLMFCLFTWFSVSPAFAQSQGKPTGQQNQQALPPTTNSTETPAQSMDNQSDSQASEARDTFTYGAEMDFNS